MTPVLVVSAIVIVAVLGFFVADRTRKARRAARRLARNARHLKELQVWNDEMSKRPRRPLRRRITIRLRRECPVLERRNARTRVAHWRENRIRGYHVDQNS